MLIRLSLLAVLLLSACGRLDGPRVRYATASTQELAAVESERVVWYEFQPGDEIPMAFAFLGMAEMGSNQLRMVVKRPFWVVIHNGQTSFSFDGRRIVADPFSRWGMIIGRGEERGRTALLMYVGPAEEAPQDLR